MIRRHPVGILRLTRPQALARSGGIRRLIEVGYNLLYNSGKISADGTLVSSDYIEPDNAGLVRNSTPSALPDHFDSHYSYDGYMELQISEPEDECTSCPCPEHE